MSSGKFVMMMSIIIIRRGGRRAGREAADHPIVTLKLINARHGGK